MPSTVQIKCKCCGIEFTARVADRARGWGKFCSKRCKAVKQEAKTGQMSAYLRRGGIGSDREETDNGMEDAGWDAHKEWTGR